MPFSDLKKNLKKDFSGLKSIKTALLGDSATQLLAQALKGQGYEVGLHLEIWEADYNQIEQQILNPTSGLYQFDPEFVVLFHAAQKKMKSFFLLDRAAKSVFAEKEIEKLRHYFKILFANPRRKVIYFNWLELEEGVFGNFANKVESSFVYQLRKFNCELMKLAGEFKNLYINDLSALQNRLGRSLVFDPKLYVNADMVFVLDFLPHVAKGVTDILLAATGKFKKCLILDLDQTLWGGVIGDDGIEGIQIGDLGIGKAFTEFQLWCRQLKQRGIILCICSQNDEAIAKEPFEKHPDMVLRLEDIAVFVANRNNKVDNIIYIQKILDIGLDAMVFVDDNPFERNLVRRHLPEVAVPELPPDPAEYLDTLKAHNYFETVSFVPSDEARTKQYQAEAKRQVVFQSFANEDDFLASLEMVSLVKPFDRFNIPRVAQLTQRSNQFNLRTQRYSETEIEKMAASPNTLTFTFTLQDKFGDNGLISVLILKKEKDFLFIDTWIMSCRVLKRGMEQFVLNTLVDCARQKGCRLLVGEYLPTPKNGLVKEHYSQLGFREQNGLWHLDVETYQRKKHFITKGAP